MTQPILKENFMFRNSIPGSIPVASHAKLVPMLVSSHVIDRYPPTPIFPPKWSSCWRPVTTIFAKTHLCQFPAKTQNTDLRFPPIFAGVGAEGRDKQKEFAWQYDISASLCHTKSYNHFLERIFHEKDWGNGPRNVCGLREVRGHPLDESLVI